MVGREPPARVERPPVDSAATPVLAVRGLSRRGCFSEMSLEVWAGEIVGIFGLVGSGRTELLETLFGVAKSDAGEIVLNGRTLHLSSVRDASRAGIALVPEDRQRLGLHFNLNVGNNIALAAAARAGLGRINRRAEQHTAQSLISALAIRSAMVDRTPDTLSGGNQQKVVAAKWLGTGPSVLLLDEPTKGVDIGAKFEIHNLVRERAAQGVACLIVSSDLPEILAVTDRIIVMREGRWRGELATADATEESVMQLATHEVAVSA